MKPSARRRGYTSLACCAKVETDRKPPPRGSPKDGATSHPTRENASPKTSRPPRARNRNRLRGRGRPAGRGHPGRGWIVLDPRGRPAGRGRERRRAGRRRANRATGIPASPGTESAPRLHPRGRASRARRGRRTMRWRPEWYRRRTTRSGGWDPGDAADARRRRRRRRGRVRPRRRRRARGAQKTKMGVGTTRRSSAVDLNPRRGDACGTPHGGSTRRLRLAERRERAEERRSAGTRDGAVGPDTRRRISGGVWRALCSARDRHARRHLHRLPPSARRASRRSRAPRLERAPRAW